MTVRTKSDIEEEAKKSQLEEFKDKLQKLEIDSLDTFAGDLKSVLPESSLVDPDLIKCSLYRVDKINSNAGQQFIDEINIFEGIKEKEIGLQYGGGIYKTIISFFIRRKDDPEKTQKLTHKVSYFQIDKSWDKKKLHNDEIEEMNQISRIKTFQNKVMSETGESHSESKNSDLMTLMMSQNQFLQNLVLGMATKESSPMDLSGIAALMTALKPAENNNNDLMLTFLKPLMEKQFNKLNQSPQTDFFQQMRQFKNFMNDFQEVSSPAAEPKESLTDQFLKEFLPVLPSIADQLLSRRANYAPQSMIDKKLQPYQKEIELINSNPEVKEATLQQLKNQGLNQNQIETIAKRAKIDLENKPIEVLKSLGGEIYEF